MPDLEVCSVTTVVDDIVLGISQLEDMQLVETSRRGIGKSDCKDSVRCRICVGDRYERMDQTTTSIGFPGHAPLIRRLQQLYRNPQLASSMTIHSRHVSDAILTTDDGDLVPRCCPADESHVKHLPHMGCGKDVDRLRTACKDVAAAV